MEITIKGKHADEMENFYYGALQTAFQLKMVDIVRYDNPDLIASNEYGFDATFSVAINDAYKKLIDIATFLDNILHTEH